MPESTEAKTDAAAKPAEAPKPKPNRKAQYNDLVLAEYKRLEYIHTPPIGVGVEELENPEYWAHVAQYLQPYTRIEVRSADGVWIAELIVKAASSFRASMHIDRVILLHKPGARVAPAQPPEAVPEGFDIKHRGATAKWTVKALSDGVMLKEGLESRSAAILWLQQHLRELAA
jgi:hypothetical protein